MDKFPEAVYDEIADAFYQAARQLEKQFPDPAVRELVWQAQRAAYAVVQRHGGLWGGDGT